MIYCSNNRNIVIHTEEDQDEQGYGTAHVTIKHMPLVEVLRSDDRSSLTVRCKASHDDVLTIPLDGTGDDFNQTELKDFKRKIKLKEGAHDSQTLEGRTSHLFHVIINEEDLNSQQQRLHPCFETVILDALTKHKREDDMAIEQFIRDRQRKCDEFEAIINAEAMALSQIAFTEPSKPIAKEDSDHKTETRVRRASGSTTSNASTSSKTSAYPRKRHHHKKKPPSRSATAPLPKSALVTPGRKASLNVPSSDDSRTTPTKRVMFAEAEPMRFDSPQFETTDTEIDADDTEDLFDMDETIPVIPIPTKAATNPMPIRPGQSPFGRQHDTGLSGSFKVRSIDKYSPAESEGNSPSVRDISEAEASPFATSIPRDIVMPPVQTSFAPLSSMKDLPALSMEDKLEQRLGELDLGLDDSPPQNMDRKQMWKMAVASSLRMSGFILPTYNNDEILNG